MHARVTERRAQRDANDAPADVLRRKRRAAPSFRRWVIGRKYRALHRRCREGRRRAAPSRPRRNFRAKYRASKASETLRGSVRRSPPISRVLLRRAMSRAMTVIPLGPPLPTGSSRLPADSASSVVVRLFGVAPDGGCRVSPASRRKRLVSVALFLAFASAARPRLLRPGVTRHPALWSPDFPLPRRENRGSDDPAGFAKRL